MQIGQIKETCLYIHDLDQAYQFYHEIMKFPLISRVEGRHVFFRVGKSVLLCFISSATRNETQLPPHYAEGKQHIAFECNKVEYEEWKRHLIMHNVAIIAETEWPGGYESFYFHDPEGHVLEIVQEGMWG